MEFLYLIIPVILSTIAFFGWEKGKKNIVLVYSPVLLCFVVLVIMSLSFRHSNFMDIEYRSYYYTKVRHYDSWDERQKRTRRVYCGHRDGKSVYRTETYYVTVDHPEKWTRTSNKDDREIRCSKEEYDSLRTLWGTSGTFIDMHRDYYMKDGDAQEYHYCGHWEHLRGFTEEHPYENRIIGTKNVLKFKEITKEEASDLGLYTYSPSPLRGWNKGKQKLVYLNAMYGKSKEIHIKVLVFPAFRGVRIVEDQKAYWQGGNKNEFIVCIGVQGGRVVWADSFSWQDDPELDVRCKEWLLSEKTLDVEKLGNWIESNLGLWKRKEFEDFSYISSYLTTTQNMIILVVIIILSIIGIVGVIIYGEKV